MLTAADVSPERLRELRLLLGQQATRIRLARALAGLSRTELALRTAISIDSLAVLERGERGLYTEEARRLCQALAIPADFLRASGASTEALLSAVSGETDQRARALAAQEGR